jgi:hypothetical protein
MLADMLALLAVSLPRVLPIIALLALIPILVAASQLAKQMRAGNGATLKPPWLFWFWRIYVPVIWFGFIGYFAAAIVTRSEILFAWFLLVFVLFGLAVQAIITGYAFSYEYSAFGKRWRMALPAEPALRTFAGSYGAIGQVRCNVPLVTWLIYREGLGIKVFPLGDIFVPWELIDRLELERGLTSTLRHHSPELRGPIRLPNGVARILAEVLERQSRHKVIIAAELATRWNPLRLFQR